MVKPTRKRNKTTVTTKALLLIGTVMTVSIGTIFVAQNEATEGLSLSALLQPETDSTSTVDVKSTSSTTTSSSSLQSEPTKKSSSGSTIVDAIISKKDNASIKTQREAIMNQCTTSSITPNLTDIKTKYFASIPESTQTVPTQQPKPSIKRCKNVVLDFGANVGDTAGHLIDAGFPNCEAATKQQEYVRLMLGDRKLEVGKWNMVTKFLKQMMDDVKKYPEDYCYYGIEGNPVFTDRLKGIEDFIHAIEPKPLVHASFLTESVGAGEYGMTKLYLDTVNTKENFWGSSIMANHQDVKKSMTEGNLSEAPHHDVMGYTITKLMELTLIGMKEDATEEEKKGSHLLLKVDIEGGEYVLTEEVVKSKALCNFVEMGNTVDVVIETHSQRVTGPNPLAHKFGGWKKELTECGVTFRGLQAWWA